MRSVRGADVHDTRVVGVGLGLRGSGSEAEYGDEGNAEK
jgi:hypothetical protein